MLAAAALAGCGGGDGFAARADAVCAEHQRALAALPEPMSVMAGVRVRVRRVEIARDEVADLRALLPASNTDAARMVAALEREVDALERLRIASITGDSEEAQGALYRGRKAHGAARRAGEALGVKACLRGP